MVTTKSVRLEDYIPLPVEDMKARATAFYSEMRKRRSVRVFSDKTIPIDIIKDCLRTAGTAPSGANQQPWHFVVVKDSAIKQKIRQETEKVERKFYGQIASEAFLGALAPLDTGPEKVFLETAPYLIVIFMQRYGLTPDREKVHHYYPIESVGIATGILIAAIHHAGLVSLPYTPNPMSFLNKILKRPENERPVMIIPVGYPEETATVPKLDRKSFDKIASFL